MAKLKRRLRFTFAESDFIKNNIHVLSARQIAEYCTELRKEDGIIRTPSSIITYAKNHGWVPKGTRKNKVIMFTTNQQVQLENRPSVAIQDPKPEATGLLIELSHETTAVQLFKLSAFLTENNIKYTIAA